MNRAFVRDLITVVVSVTLVTTLGLWMGHQLRTAPGVLPSETHASAVPPRSLEALGERLYNQKSCVSCHSIDGSSRVGPSFRHDYGTEVPLGDGTTVAMDDAYVRESILDPRAKSRPGYPAVMPSFEGMLKPRELDALVAYIRSLR